jgi:hypothetical protein
MFLNDFLLIYAKKLLFPELCKKDLFKKRFLFLGSLRGVPLNVRVYPLTSWVRDLRSLLKKGGKRGKGR